MGNFIKVPGINPPTDRPRVDLLDSILPDTGALMLLDPTHPSQQWQSGVPVDNAVVPNLAAAQARQMIPLAVDDAAVGGIIKVGAGFTGSMGKLERSGRGGLHGIVSLSGGNSSAISAGIRPSQAIVDYIVANPDHKYFISTWAKFTRFTQETGALAAWALAPTGSATELFFSMASDGRTYPETAKRLGFRRSRTQWRPSQDAAVTPPFADNIISNVAVNGYTGTPALTGSAAQNQMKVFGVGGVPAFPAGSTPASRIFYRSYVEDLTVSGRSYAEIDALDFAAYTKEVLTVGGRYHGDTYTDPATMP